MEYTIQKLSRLAGVSARTLRYYDQIKLLCPKRNSSSGYRIYGQAEVDMLQQILFYRELGMELSEIKQILEEPDYDRLAALKEHAEHLEIEKNRITSLLDNVKKTILKEEGSVQMSDKEKFEGFKKKLITENEEKFGKEIREKYGEEKVAESNRKMMNLSQEEYDRMEVLGKSILSELETAVTDGQTPASAAGQKIAALHKEWLSFTWKEYRSEAHAGLAEMYVNDERFTAYYDGNVAGCAKFLRDAVRIFVK